MLSHSATTDASKTEGQTRAGESPLSSLWLATGVGRRKVALIVAAAIGCASLGFLASRLATPRYLATAQIYIDPSAMQGSGMQSTAARQDAHGYVDYVESQVLIAASRSVLERVVKEQNLDRDPEFASVAGGAWFGALTGAEGGHDAAAAAVRALRANLRVERAESSFVLDLSVTSRDPARAAELANGVAHAFVDEFDAMHSGSARQSGAAMAGRLEGLRQRVLEADKNVEDYKASHGLASAPSEQQLKDVNDQILAARQRATDSRSLGDQIELARRRGDDIDTLSSQLDLSSLAPLRAQHDEARRKLAEAVGRFGWGHPRVADAQARLRAAGAAVDAELARLAQNQRSEYERAKTLEASLTRQLDDLKRQSKADDQTMSGLRELERKAVAAREVYEVLAADSRDGGPIQQVEAQHAKIISAAAPPDSRAFPPSSWLFSGVGSLLGLGLGWLVAVRREGRGEPPADASETSNTSPSPSSESAPEPASTTPEETLGPPAAASLAEAASGRPLLTVGAAGTLRVRMRRQSLDRLDLIDLGFLALPANADAAEFEAVLRAIDFADPPTRELPWTGSRRRFVLAVAGSNDDDARTALAINLALTAARSGARVVLLDAAGRNAKLTRAVRTVARKSFLDRGPIYQTENDVCLALPKAVDPELGRLRPEEMLRRFVESRDDAVELIVCDGPGATEIGASNVFEYAHAIVAVDSANEAATLDQLAELGFAPSALVRFETNTEAMRKSA